MKFKSLLVALLISQVGFFSLAQTSNGNDEDYRWLYEQLLPEPARLEQPQETFKSFRVHLKDSFQIFPDPAEIRWDDLLLRPRIQGLMTYVGIFKRRYAYDINETAPRQLRLQVRVHLKNANEVDIKDFSEKMREASEFWNRNAVDVDFHYEFDFLLEKDPKKAHFSVSVLDSTNGPYDQFWGRDWTSKTVAHEIGHMLGLGDEYQTLSGVFDCYRPSLMCSAWKGEPFPHHYYFILRRLSKNTGAGN